MKKVVASLMIGVLLGLFPSSLILRETEVVDWCVNEYEIKKYGFPMIVETKVEVITDPQKICNAIILDPQPKNETMYVGYLINSLFFGALTLPALYLLTSRKDNSS